MAGSVDRGWRILGTGASFAFFGVGSLFLGVIAFPILALRHRDAARRELAMQRWIHVAFQAFAGFMKLVGVIEVSFPDAGRLRPGPRLLIANHPTLIDYVLLVAHLPQADCVVKRAHWTNPITAGVVRGAGYIPNDTGESTLAACARRLEAGRTVLLFPEGTRSPRGGLGPFQRGAAHVSIATEIPAWPVTIRNHPPGLMRDQPWYDVPERRMRFEFHVGEPIAPLTGEPSRGRASRKLTSAYREHIAKHLGIAHDAPSSGGRAHD